LSIAIITTGGTITQVLGGSELRHLHGAELLSGLSPEAEGMPAVDVHDLMDLPSTYVGPDEMLRIAEAVRRQLGRDDVEGVVVTHGTATIEETVYFVDLVVETIKPVVFTGAQRFPGTAGYDGHRNLRDAITVARTPSLAPAGVMLVFDGEIHTAREVVEFHPTSTAGFRSLDTGPIGRVDLDRVVLTRMPLRDGAIHQPRTPLARVDMLTCYAGMSGDVVHAVGALGGGGLVVNGMTSGAVPPAVVPALQDLINNGTVVVLSTRCPAGRVVRRSGATYDRVVGYGTDLERLGIALTDLPGLKARCRLLVLLSAGLERDAVHQLMDTAA
jgi:L-asparaginase